MNGNRNRRLLPRRARLLGRVGLGLLTGLWMAAGPAAAAVLRVPLDHATINDALAVAVADDEIRVSEDGSPYLERIVLIDGVRLVGGYDSAYDVSDPTARETTIELPADSTGSVVGMAAVGDQTLLAGFTIRGGDTVNGGGIFCGSGSAATIRNCIVRDNFANTAGGGIQIGIGSEVLIQDCHILDNVATLRGGGINVAANAPDAEIVHCTIEACSTAVLGQTVGGGGGVATLSGIRLEANTLRANWSGSRGGGLLVVGADIRASDNLFFDNVAVRNGGGIFHSGGNGVHLASLVEDGTATRGGGIYFEGGTNRFLDGFVRRNTASIEGGGIHFFEPASGALVRTTEIVGNRAPAGGGIMVTGVLRASFVDIVSNTIVANEATGTDLAGDPLGGGIQLSNQLVSDPGGGILNNIIAVQLGGAAIYCDGLSASPLIRYNCVYNDDAVNLAEEYGGTCTDRTGINGNISNNPRLCCNPDCDQVGPPPPDLALAANSPCLGAGEGGVDMGAHPAAVGCGVISIEESSWGAIKARYR